MYVVCGAMLVQNLAWHLYKSAMLSNGGLKEGSVQAGMKS